MEDRAKRWLHLARQRHVLDHFPRGQEVLVGAGRGGGGVKTVNFTVSIRDANSAVVLKGANPTTVTIIVRVGFVVIVAESGLPVLLPAGRATPTLPRGICALEEFWLCPPC